jgi:hypothetical protein
MIFPQLWRGLERNEKRISTKLQRVIRACDHCCSTETNRVEGNVTQAGRIGNVKDAKASKQPLRPDEVLFRGRNAPVRYEESDYYFAHELLPAGQQLPSGNLLSALHSYVSKLYSRVRVPEMEKAFRCMDATALIAFGILIEETAREKLGESGDLAFTEADEEGKRALGGEEDVKGDERAQVSKTEASLQGEQVREAVWSSDDTSEYNTDASL